jgi:CheY-like chemotaxis protein
MSGIRVLLVDDEVELITTLQERLELRNIVAEAVTTGHDALERIQQADFDVVVVDLKMPGLGGSDVVEVIRKRRPKTKVILITGHGARHEELEELMKNGHRILLKPFRIQHLVEVIREAAAGGETER